MPDVIGVCFPNFPDAVTGKKLEPGGKTVFFSFNHDSGSWEIAATNVARETRQIEHGKGSVGTVSMWHWDPPAFLDGGSYWIKEVQPHHGRGWGDGSPGNPHSGVWPDTPWA